MTPEIIIKYEFIQKINFSEYNLDENDNDKKKDIIFTKNNFISVDLDEYFDDSFNILKQYDLIKEEKKEEEKEKTKEVEDDDEIEDDNLIDELFGEIEKDEDEKNEGKKEENK